MTLKAIVVGAGLAGLTTAYRLHQAGWQVKLIERAGEVGGRAVSVSKQGYLFDSGAVGIGTVYKDLMGLVADLGLSDQVVRSSTVSATLRGGRVHEIDAARPITGVTTKLLSLGAKFKLVNLFRDLAKIRPQLDIRDVAAAAQFDDETVETYARRRLNPELLEYFIEPMLRTLNLNRAANISKLELMNALAGLFDTQFVTLRGGVAVLARKLAEGMDLRLDTEVLEVRRQPGHVEVTYRDPVQGSITERADVAVIATPLPQALQLYPPARTHYAPLADVITYNRGLCVHLGFSAATRTGALMVMMPPSEQPEIALLFLEHNKAPDRAPAGHSMITVFFDETTIDRPWAMGDEALIAHTATVVENILPELAGRLAMSHVTRWSPGLTNPGLGIYKAMQAVNRAVDPTDRVQLVGDYRSTAGQNSAVAWGNNVARDLIRTFAA